MRRQTTFHCLRLIAWVDGHPNPLRTGQKTCASISLAWNHVILADQLAVRTRPVWTVKGPRRVISAIEPIATPSTWGTEEHFRVRSESTTAPIAVHLIVRITSINESLVETVA